MVSGGSRGTAAPSRSVWPWRGCRFNLSREPRRSGESGQADRGLGPTRARLGDDVTEPGSIKLRPRKLPPSFGSSPSWSTMPVFNKPTDFDFADPTRILGHKLATNLRGPFVCAQVFLPLSRRSGRRSGAPQGLGQRTIWRTAHRRITRASKAGPIPLAQVIARFGAPPRFSARTRLRPDLSLGDPTWLLRRPGTAVSVLEQRRPSCHPLLEAAWAQPRSRGTPWCSSPAKRLSYITAQTINVNGGLYF